MSIFNIGIAFCGCCDNSDIPVVDLCLHFCPLKDRKFTINFTETYIFFAIYGFSHARVYAGGKDKSTS